MMTVCPGCGGYKPMRAVQCAKCDELERDQEHHSPVKRARPQFVYVYCITSGELGSTAIKFGQTESLRDRLAALASSAAVPLRVVGSVSARRTLESRILKHLQPHRCWGEWFSPVPEVIAMARHFESNAWGSMLDELGIVRTSSIINPSSRVL